MTLIAILAAALGASTAQAGKSRFGEDEQIRELASTQDQTHTLGHKVTFSFFGAGYAVTDDGYVLQPLGVKDSYITLTPELTQVLQQSGQLPTPLPPYSLSAMDYLLGYSLWIILAAVIGFGVLKWAWKRSRGGGTGTMVGNAA